MWFHPSYHLAGGSPLPLDMGIFFGTMQHSPDYDCSAVSCNFGVLAREDEHKSFHSAILRVQSGIICLSKVTDISSCNLDSTLGLIQPSISHDVLAYKLNKQGDNIQPWRTPFPILIQSIVPCLVLTVASWPAYRFHRRQVRWSGIPIFLMYMYIYFKHILNYLKNVLF